MLTFQLNFVSEEYLMDLVISNESRQISVNRNVCKFSFDYNSIDKFNILNIHKYLMLLSNIK